MENVNVLAEHMAAPRNRGPMVNPTGVRVYLDPASGTALRIQVRIEQGHLSEVRFSCFGDPVLVGVASFVTCGVEGHSLDVLARLQVEHIVAALQLPPNKARWADLVLLTLLEAVQDHHLRRRLEREVGS